MGGSAEVNDGIPPPPLAVADEKELDAGAQFVLKSRGDHTNMFSIFCILRELRFWV